MSGLAEELGADHVSVTDIYPPCWIVTRIVTDNVLLVAVAAPLHARVFQAFRAALTMCATRSRL